MPRLQARIKELMGQLTSARTQREVLEKRLREVDAERRKAQAQLQASASETRPLQARVAELQAQLERLEQRPPVDTSAHERELEALRSTVRDLEAKLHAVEQAQVADDLKRIRGIGPAYERALLELGVTTFAQIAAWSEDDVERISGQLKINASRIARGRWIELAAELASTTTR